MELYIQVGFGAIGTRLIELLKPQYGLIIDPDTFETKNLENQLISPEDVGQPKVALATKKYGLIGVQDIFRPKYIVKDLKIGMVMAVDNFRARMRILEALYAAKQSKNIRLSYVVDVGIDIDYSEPDEPLYFGHITILADPQPDVLHDYLNFILKHGKESPNRCIVFPAWLHATAAALAAFTIQTLDKKTENHRLVFTKIKGQPIAIEKHKI